MYNEAPARFILIAKQLNIKVQKLPELINFEPRVGICIPTCVIKNNKNNEKTVEIYFTGREKENQKEKGQKDKS